MRAAIVGGGIVGARSPCVPDVQAATGLPVLDIIRPVWWMFAAVAQGGYVGLM